MFRLANLGAIAASVALCWPAMAFADHEVPYSDSVEGTGVVGPIVGPLVTVHIQGDGLGTHLGSFRVEGDHILNFATGTVTGSGTYTTKDGSTLDGTYTGTFTQDDAGNRFLHLDVEFGSGTGRLARITGSAHSEVVVTPSSTTETTFSYTSEGTLTFPDNRP